MQKSGSRRNQTLITVLFTALVFMLVVFTTLIFINVDQGGQEGYVNVTMTDAYLSCSQRLRSETGSQLQSYSMDNISTRYDAERKRHLIFMRANFMSDDRSIENGYVTCEVASSGRIGSFSISVQVDGGDGPKTRSRGNAFGFDFP